MAHVVVWEVEESLQRGGCDGFRRVEELAHGRWRIGPSGLRAGLECRDLDRQNGHLEGLRCGLIQHEVEKA
jgi:hypothetical protein